MEVIQIGELNKIQWSSKIKWRWITLIKSKIVRNSAFESLKLPILSREVEATHIDENDKQVEITIVKPVIWFHQCEILNFRIYLTYPVFCGTGHLTQIMLCISKKKCKNIDKKWLTQVDCRLKMSIVLLVFNEVWHWSKNHKTILITNFTIMLIYASVEKFGR